MDTEKAYNSYKHFCRYALREAEDLEKETQQEIKSLNAVISGADTAFSASGEEIEKRYRTALKKLDLYYTIAREHCRLRIEDVSASAEEPDFSALSRMASSIGKYDYNDPRADELVRVLAGNYGWVKKMRDKELGSVGKKDVSGEKQRLREVTEQYERDQLALKYDLSQMLIDMEEETEALRNAFALAQVSSEDFEKAAEKAERLIPMYMVRRELFAPPLIEDELAEKLEGVYDKGSASLSYPHFEGIEGGNRLLITYKENADAVRGEVVSLVLNFLKRVPPSQLRISLIDRVSYSPNMIRGLLPLGGVLDPVPGSESEIVEYVKKLAEIYREIERKLDHKSLDRFIQEGGSFPYRLLILHEEGASFGGQDALRYLKENAGALGITVITVRRETGSEAPRKEAGCEAWIREENDGFRLEDGTYASLLSGDAVIPDSFRALLVPAAEEKKISNLMKDHVSFRTPMKGLKKRGRISVPFAVDDSGKVIEADFTNTNFAAFMEGAAGSGKSSLLHVIITGLMMRYHPDDIELWLADFKMTEFGEYAKQELPHVKCVLLDSSEDLVYDLVDRLTDKLNERKLQFSKNNWSSIGSVPADVYMPEIFVIIDEFGDMSKVLQRTAGEGADRDYRDKMEYLLRESRSFGFHYIFSNQAFTEGSQGLSEMAKLQIRSRFALLNERSEIRAILDAGSSNDERVLEWIKNIRPFETLFRVQEGDEFVIRKYTNLYIPEDDRQEWFKKIKARYEKSARFDPDDDRAYLKKDLVMIDGTRPQSFEENLRYMIKKEDDMYLSKGDVPIFAGAPMSFERVEHFTLRSFAAENVLLIAQDPRHQTAVARSVLDSWKRRGLSCEIWADPGQSAFESFGRSVLDDIITYTDLGEICERVDELKRIVKKKKTSPDLIVVMGYDRICSAMELMADAWDDEEGDDKEPEISAAALLDEFEAATDIEEKRRIKKKIDEFNAGIASAAASSEDLKITDARDDIRRLIKLGPIFGIHFLFVFERAAAFKMTPLDISAFGHRLLFSMSRDDAMTLEASRQHPELLSAGCFMYTDGQRVVSMRPYMTKGVPLYPGWELGDEGEVTERKA